MLQINTYEKNYAFFLLLILPQEEVKPCVLREQFFPVNRGNFTLVKVISDHSEKLKTENMLEDTETK